MRATEDRLLRSAVRVGGCAWIVMLASTAGTVYAAEGKNPGKVAYLRYCSACHGSEGKGDGAGARFLRPKPTDLTGLAKANHGEFPFIKVVRAIDGTTAIGVHGERGMPV